MIGALNSGAWANIRPMPNHDLKGTLAILGEEIVTWVKQRSRCLSVDCIEDAMRLYRYKRVKTLLSRAPHPLRPALMTALRKKGFDVVEDGPVRNFLNDMARGKTGRFEVDAIAARNGTRLYINIVTAQDGNESHKRKEMAARIRAAHVGWDNAARKFTPVKLLMWLILDGDWPAVFVGNLYEAGADRVFPATSWGELMSALDSV